MDVRCPFCNVSFVTSYDIQERGIKTHYHPCTGLTTRYKNYGNDLWEVQPDMHKLQEEDEERYELTAATEYMEYDLTQIPFEALRRLGTVFKEGADKYGKDNWLQGVSNKSFQIERANHTLKHLLIYIHKLTRGEDIGEAEDDLAKVMWYCAIQCELERLEKL